MRVHFAIFFFAFTVLVLNTSQAELEECTPLLSSQASSLNYVSQYVDNAKINSDIRRVLKKTPKALIQTYSPNYEDLLELDLDSEIFKNRAISINEDFASVKSLTNVLALFRPFQENSDYYFIGNGFYISYLLAKTLFEGTPLFSRIHFLAFSRELTLLAFKQQVDVSSYLKSLEVGQSQAQKIVVIDSVSASESNRHSLLNVSYVLRKYLMSQGLNYSKAISKVISLGIPEDTNHQHESYIVKNLPDYFQRLSNIEEKDYATASVPYFNPNLNWSIAPFMMSYDQRNLYWNYKFNSLGTDKRPQGVFSLEDSISSKNQLEQIVSTRAHLVSRLRNMIQMAQETRKSLQGQISAIVNSQQ